MYKFKRTKIADYVELCNRWIPHTQRVTNHSLKVLRQRPMLPYDYDEDTLAWILSSDWNFLKGDANAQIESIFVSHNWNLDHRIRRLTGQQKRYLLPYIATIVLIQDFVASYSRNDICHNAALMVVKLVYDLTDLQVSIEDRGYCSKKFLSFRQVDKQRVIVWAAKLVVIQSQMCHMDMFYGALRHWNSCCRMIIFMLGFKTWGGSNGNSKVQIETWFSGDFFGRLIQDFTNF